MNIIDLIASASSPDEISVLLSAMGQKSFPPKPEAIPNQDPAWQAQGQFFQADLGQLQSPAAAQALLNSMGQTGAYSENVPMSPSTSAGLNSPLPDTSGIVPQGTTPVTAEERAWIDASYAQSDQLINDLIAKDPALRAQLGIKTDDDYRDIPSTGQADTRGGVARVNQYTKDHGVTASRDSSGRVTLTNIDPATGKPTPQSTRQFYGFNPMDATSSTSVTALLGQLRAAPDYNTAQGIAASLRTSLAEEEAKLTSQAMTFGEQQVGIPQLRQRLAEAEALDQRTPGWMPGIGDSKNTAALRSALYQAQGQARTMADDWLKRNMTAAQLRAAGSNAEAELKRLAKLQDTKDQAIIRATEARENKRLVAEMQAEAEYDSLSPEQKMLIAKLNPELASKPDNRQELVKYFDRQVKTDPEFKQLVQTPPERVPYLALAGNSKARALVIAEEQKATGRDGASIDQELKRAAQSVTSKEAINAYIEERVALAPNKVEARKQLQAQIATAPMATGEEAKKAWREMQGDIAMSFYKKQRTNSFVSNVASWGDPELEPAIKKALETSGKADLTTVMNAYIGDKVGPEAIAAAKLFQDRAKLAASKYSNSPFGGLNSLAINAMITDNVVRTGVLTEWFQRATGISAAQTTRALQDYRNAIAPQWDWLGLGGKQGN